MSTHTSTRFLFLHDEMCQVCARCVLPSTGLSVDVVIGLKPLHDPQLARHTSTLKTLLPRTHVRAHTHMYTHTRTHANTHTHTPLHRLWGENFFDPATKKWTTKQTDSKTCQRGFIQFCYDPIKKVRGMLCLGGIVQLHFPSFSGLPSLPVHGRTQMHAHADSHLCTHVHTCADTHTHTARRSSTRPWQTRRRSCSACWRSWASPAS